MSITAEQLNRVMPSAAGLLSDEPEMESSLHYLQLLILYVSLEYHWRERNDYFIGANLTVYYNREQLKSRDFRGPDLFIVTDVEKRARNSWVVWEEGGRYPDLIIELLSDSTTEIDRTIKRDLYARRFRTPEYFWFSPQTEEFAGFQLASGSYQEIPANDCGWRWSEVLNLYLGIHNQQLRYFTHSGQLVPTPEEAALQMQEELAQKDETARKLQQQLKRETRRAARLAAKLKELGINPDEI